MSSRPITDVWILGRSKTKDPETGRTYYGAYPAGFLERARPMLVGGNPDACILHVCGGHARGYNRKYYADLIRRARPDAILIDRPYSVEDAKNYRCGPDVLPDLNKLLADCLSLTDGHVGVIDYAWPSAKGAKEVAAVAVGTGRNGRARWFTVWKRTR